MPPCSVFLLFLFLLAPAPFTVVRAHSAGSLYFPSIPEDPYAFPKYRVSFLNGFSLPNTTAQRWLSEGLKGGEAEFLGLGKEPTTSADRVNDLSPKAIEPGDSPDGGGGGGTTDSNDNAGLTVSVRDSSASTSTSFLRLMVWQSQAQEPTLQLMHLSTKSSYLCLIPPPSPPSSPTSHEDRASSASAVRSPASSWELLQPMSQGCLYVSYSYSAFAPLLFGSIFHTTSTYIYIYMLLGDHPLPPF
jgi:protein OS-9